MQDDGLADAGQSPQGVLDLAEFDAEAAQFHLGVAAAEPFDGAVGPVGAEVAGAAQPLAGAAVGVGDVGGGGEAGAAEVAAADGPSAEVDLAGDADRDGLEVVVEDVDAGVAHRGADGRPALAGGEVRGDGPHGGLGEAVHVLEAAAS